MLPSFSRLSRRGFGISLAFILLLSSCAAGPAARASDQDGAAAASDLKVPAPVAKERIVLVKTPVLVKESVFYPDGLLDEYTVYAYEPSLNLLLEKAVFLPSVPQARERTTSEYGPDRRPSQDLVYDAEGKIRQRRQYSFDAAGLLVSERILDAAGSPQSSSSFAYDAQGRRSEWRAFDGRGILKASTLYSYNGAGRPLLVELRDSTGTSLGSFRYEYGGTGQIEKKSLFGADGRLQSYEILEYLDGRPRRYELHRPDDTLVETREYQYGSLGELLLLTTMDGSGRLREKRAYEYKVREDQKVEIYFE